MVSADGSILLVDPIARLAKSRVPPGMARRYPTAPATPSSSAGPCPASAAAHDAFGTPIQPDASNRFTWSAGRALVRHASYNYS